MSHSTALGRLAEKPIAGGLLAWTGLVWVIASCSFSPSFPEGKIACNAKAANSCPPGLACVDGFCRAHAPDSGVPTSTTFTPSDGGAAEADALGADAPVGADAVDASPVDADARATDGSHVADTPAADASVATDVKDVDVSARAETSPDRADDLETRDTASSRDSGPDDARDARDDVANQDVAGKDSASGDVASDGPMCQTTCQPGDTRCGPSGGLQTCATVAGCPEWGNETPCGGSKTCRGTSPNADCTCATSPSYCTGVGMTCTDANTLASCQLDSSQCLVSTTISCASSGLICAGTFPDASCRSACPPTPVGCEQGVGSGCASNQVLTCSKDSNGCYRGVTTACPTGMLCGGSFPDAKCSCPPAPAGCENGVPRGCSGTDVITCSTDVNNCVHGSISACSTNNLTPACSAGACVGVCDADYADCNSDKQTDGCEVHVTNDPSHCGSCTTACNPGVVCQAGTCAITRWGLSSAGTTDTFGIGPGALAAMTVSISAAGSNLVALGAQTLTAGVKFRLGLYSNPSGAPSTLLAQTGELTSTVSGRVEGYFSATSIATGTYWVAILSQASIQIVAESTAASYFVATPVSYGGLPSQFPSSSTASTFKAHLFAITSP